jgi:hypothetical protein
MEWNFVENNVSRVLETSYLHIPLLSTKYLNLFKRFPLRRDIVVSLIDFSKWLVLGLQAHLRRLFVRWRFGYMSSSNLVYRA